MNYYEYEVQRGRRYQRRVQRRRGALAALLAFTVLVVVVGGGLFAGYRFLSGTFNAPDYQGEGHGHVVVEIQQGDTITDMGNRLYRAGVVRSAQAFIGAAEGDPDASTIQPGHYELNKQMSGAIALEYLLNPATRILARVPVPEGTRLSTILDRIAAESDIPRKQLQAVVEQPERVGLPAYARGVEGYLFPATYDIEPDDTATETLRAMVDQFDHTAKQLRLKRGAEQVGLTPHELVTVASLVQAEARRSADFPKVARVIYNRLRRGEPLQLDATVNYALNRSTLIVSSEDLEVKSPYNTYKHNGLPPGPINSPGTRALRAAMNPADGDWLWFVTTDPKRGITKFTASYQEFLELKREFQNNTR